MNVIHGIEVWDHDLSVKRKKKKKNLDKLKN